VGIVAFFLVAAVVGGGLAIKSSRDKAAAESAEASRRLRESEESLARLQGEIKASQEKESELKAALASAKSDADRARIQGELDAVEKKTEAAKTRVSGLRAPSGGGGASKPKPAKTESNCAPGDPMCG
jgi:septal ring factor EnvC (AmiA/AmiB activator)